MTELLRVLRRWKSALVASSSAALEKASRGGASFEETPPRQGPAPSVPPLWEGFDHYESSVLLAMRDLVKRGDLVYDVGANIGGISLTASRAVGPFGKVISFEASPRVMPELLANLQSWHATNVFLVPRAVWGESNRAVELYFGEGHYADSLYSQDASRAPDHVVLTIALDDFVAETGRAPDFVKFDIEGAEYDALQGFEGTLRDTSPNMIFETRSDDERLCTWLEQRGYALFNTNDYSPFAAAPTQPKLTNIVAIAEREKDLLDCLRQAATEHISTHAASDFRSDEQSAYLELGRLSPGRYVLHLEPGDGSSSDETITEIQVQLLEPCRLVNLHISPWNHLAYSYRSLPFHVDRDSPAFLRVKRRSMEDIPDMIREASLSQLVSGVASAPWMRHSIRF